MRCVVCLDTELVPHIRDGIEVDSCPRCRGVWLDRGELEKLLDLVEARSPEPRITPSPVDRRTRDHHGDRYDGDVRRGSRKRKRKGAFAEILEEVFDAFD